MAVRARPIRTLMTSGPALVLLEGDLTATNWLWGMATFLAQPKK
jgi:hypothetical protein